MSNRKIRLCSSCEDADCYMVYHPHDVAHTARCRCLHSGPCANWEDTRKYVTKHEAHDIYLETEANMARIGL